MSVALLGGCVHVSLYSRAQVDSVATGVWESGDPLAPPAITVETRPRWHRRARARLSASCRSVVEPGPDVAAAGAGHVLAPITLHVSVDARESFTSSGGPEHRLIMCGLHLADFCLVGVRGVLDGLLEQHRFSMVTERPGDA